MSFLPGSLTPALLRSCHRKVISHSDGHSVVGCRKTKRTDYTEHQKSAGAWLSLQSDVLCNRLWKFKVGFCFIQLPPTEPKAWWSSSELPVYRYRVGWNRLIQYGRTILFSCYVVDHRCAIIIQIMCYAVKVANPLTVFGTTENENQRVQKSSFYLLGHFQEKYQWAKKILSNLGRIFKIHFRPSWLEVRNLTSVQVGQKLKS